MSRCPPREQLQQLLAEQLSEALREAIETHVEGCGACQETLARLNEEGGQIDPRLLGGSGAVPLPASDADFVRHLGENPSGSADTASAATDAPGPAPIAFPGPPTDKGPLGQLDRFAIRKELGHGQFGVVYQAYDELDRLVALKVLKPELAASAKERARFEKEARQAAAVKHDHIVTIHQVGHTPGFPLPYLVMEYLDGEALSDRLRRLGVVEPREATRIVREVASALAAAHARGLVHRDIKPSNIFVETGTGRAKITDFGLARVVEDTGPRSSQSGRIVGTPAYMSPEQITAPDSLDGRSDVYSLGVVLYELLTGERPFQGVTHLVLQQVVHDEPRSPRKLNDSIARDLETITLKCLAKEPGQRYQTAAELAEELQRWQQGQPIRARPLGVVGRLRRWSRRKPALARLTSLLVVGSLALAVGVVVVTGLNRQLNAANADLVEKTVQLDAGNQELAASNANERQARDRAEKVLEYFVATFRRADPTQDGEKVTIAEVLKRSARELPTEASLERATRGALLNAIGLTYLGLGLPHAAVEVLEQARKLRREHLGPDHPDTLTSMHNLASAYQDAGRLADALPLFEETLKLSKAKLGPDDPDTLTSMHNLASAYYDAGRLADALPLAEETLKLRKAKLGPDHPDILSSMTVLAGAYQAAGRLADALPLFEETLKLSKAKRGRDHPHTLLSMNNLARAYRAADRLVDALPLYEETLKLQKAKLRPDHPDTLLTMNNLAVAYKHAGRLGDALPLYEETLKLYKSKLGPNHPNTLASMNNLASAYQDAGRLAHALPLFEETLKLSKANPGPEHAHTLQSMNNLASAYQAAGRLADALPLFEEILKLRKAKPGPEHADTLISMNNLAAVYQNTGRLADALPLYEETLKLQKAKLGPEHADTLNSMNNLASLYWRMKRLDRSIPLFEKCLKFKTARLGPDHADTLLTAANLGVNYRDAGRLADALPLLEATLKRAKEKLSPEHPHTLLAMHNLALAYGDAGRLADALPLLEAMLKVAKAKLGPEHPNTLISINNLAGAYRDAGRPADALPLLREVLDKRRQRLAPPLDIATSLAFLGRILTELDQAAEAEPHLREALALEEKHRPAGHPSTAYIRSLLGGCLAKQTKFSDAEPLLLQGYQGLAQAKATPPKRLREALERLVQLYDAWGQQDKADEWRKKLEAAKAATQPTK